MPNRLRPIERTGLFLLSLWILTLLLITGYTIKLLLDEDLINIEIRKQARTHAFALLINQMDINMREILQYPGQFLR